VFPNADERLWPGQFINARLQLSIARNAVVVPSTAVLRGPNGLYVYMVKSGDVAAVQPIKMGQDDGQVAVVTDGLAGTETVVISGQSRLTDGMKVAPLPVKGAANEQAGMFGATKQGG
jgi:multidrug efflux system membrane fusion protein